MSYFSDMRVSSGWRTKPEVKENGFSGKRNFPIGDFPGVSRYYLIIPEAIFSFHNEGNFFFSSERRNPHKRKQSMGT